MRSLLALSLSSLSLFAACSSDDVVDELAGETSEDEALDGKADAAVDGSYTYFAIRGDARRCAYPMCGGFFLERVNRTTTQCVDGSTSDRCYAPDLDWSESGLSLETQASLVGQAAQSAFASQGIRAVVRGRFAPRGLTDISASLGRFVVTEAWVAEGAPMADGVFVRVKDAGVRCITTPCESLKEKGLNTSRHAMIAGIDYAEAELSDTQLEAVVNAMFEPSGIILAGSRYTIKENGSRARGRTATAVYRRLADAAPTQGACFVGGCSGQICSDREGAISTCEWREEYACYQTATCERQDDGNCGWTQTAELNSCLGTAN